MVIITRYLQSKTVKILRFFEVFYFLKNSNALKKKSKLLIISKIVKHLINFEIVRLLISYLTYNDSILTIDRNNLGSMEDATSTSCGLLRSVAILTTS